ncbi:MAG: hypothetical protein CMM32_03470 [Rhodospirillaceae bacterium]|nr:hypothetical protein [Rhodospirillaceae bacterium]
MIAKTNKIGLGAIMENERLNTQRKCRIASFTKSLFYGLRICQPTGTDPLNVILNTRKFF